MGGVHGGETDFFLTFDNQTGRILGISDFFTKTEFNAAVEELTRQLNARMGSDTYTGGELTAELDYDSNVTAVHSKILNEKVNGSLYPRPAITKYGIVFSYQTYEKGSNTDGILHFILPFSDDLKIVTR